VGLTEELDFSSRSLLRMTGWGGQDDMGGLYSHDEMKVGRAVREPPPTVDGVCGWVGYGVPEA